MTERYLRGILDRYANSVTITRGGRTEAANAFVQPLRRRHRLYINDKTIPAGYFDNAYRLYIGDKRHHLSHGDVVTISCSGDAYTVVTSEEFIVGNEIAYIWAILKPQNRMEDDYDDLGG